MRNVINVEVHRSGSESSQSLLRRFSKRMQSAGVLQRVRRIRYKTRLESPLKRKQSALKLLLKWAERERLAKLGKLPTSKK